jgi:diguanylate cyclase (GGDEF)-like protein
MEEAMGTFGSFVGTIRRHPRSSIQDALLIAATMLVSFIIALEYDVVSFWDDYDASQHRIRLEEIFALTGLLGVGVFAFAVRRLYEERRDLEQLLKTQAESRENRALAMQDAMTGLPNRRALAAALDKAIASAEASGEPFAFYMLDLNGFKRVNDKYGHAVGDETLRSVANRFRAAARKEDLVARLGGDEFAALAYGVGNRERASEIGERFVAALRNEIHLGDCKFALGVAVGVAFYPEDGATAEEVMRHADLAMYGAKNAKVSRLQFFVSSEQSVSILAQARQR